MIDGEVDDQVRDYDYRLQMQGANLDTYFKYTGSTMESLRESFRPGRSVTSGRVLLLKRSSKPKTSLRQR